MQDKASSSQTSICLSKSNALSHVYIQNLPLRCSIPGSIGLFYDDGNKLLLSPTSSQVLSWKIAPFDPHVEPNSDSVNEGPILSLRYSLDTKIIAILRSRHEIQFWNKETGGTFCHKCSPESGSILGFFWTDCPACNIVIVKSCGLDMMICEPEMQNLRLIESKRINVSWYIYTHESRLVLLASGMQCKSFTGFQLSSAGIIRLPKFDMLMSKSEVNSMPVLAPEDIHVITVYGRIYCLQIDRMTMVIHCYRFYRDAVVQQGSLPIYSKKVAVSVVDNVLLVHQVDAKVVILYDLFADSRAPISAPLPLLLREYPRASTSSRHTAEDDGTSELKQINDTAVTLYGDGWTFLIPDLICDTTSGLMWKIQLDLDAISASNSEVLSVLEFLQRRKFEAIKAKELCLVLVRTIILEHRPVVTVAQALDVLITSYSHALKSGSYFKGMKTETTSASDSQRVQCPRLVADEISNRESPSITIDSAAAAVSNESFNQSLTASDSDSELNVGSSSAINNVVKGAETSGSKVAQSSLQSQLPGPSSVHLDANNAEHVSQITTAAISPDEVFRFVFTSVDDEMSGDPGYLVAIIIEFLRSASLEKIRIYPSLYVLLIQLLARSDRYTELSFFIFDKIIEPSKEVAYQLLESGRQHRPTRKLGIDMLRQLCLHHDYVLSLLQDGLLLDALRYARKHKVVTIRPSLFLEAAHTSKDSQRLAAVLRFFSDFTPGFKSTSDHATYCHILNQMNDSTIVA